VDLRKFIRLLRGHWLLIVCVTVIAVGGSVALTARIKPEYASSVTFYVSAQAKAANDPIAAYEGALFSQQEVQSYVDLLTGPALGRAVARQLGPPATGAQVSSEITARLVPQTVLLTATVTAISPQRAQFVAGAVGVQFVRMVSELERPPGKGAPNVKVTVVGAPQLSDVPVSPEPVRNALIALGLGLLAGIGLAAARQSLDTTIKSPDQIGSATRGKPVLGTVPYDHGARKRPLIAPDSLFGARAEAYRKIRTNLRFLDVDTPHKVLMITSSIPEEGKSSTVCNLAISFAQTANRVIVVEADLRRPRAIGYLGLPGGVGLTNVLVGKADIQEAVQIWGDGLFHVLTSGPVAPNPSELLGSRRMADLLDYLRDAYDVVLVDAPPVLPFADAVATGPACDGAILIVRYGKTRADHLRRTTETLTTVNIPVLGSVLNMAPGGRSPEYGYGYRYYQSKKEPAHAMRAGQDSEPQPTSDS
jgi:capsular exopolysaccharide synthesis family protein